MHIFNFDEWSALYKSDPSMFERKRNEVLQEIISNSPIEHRSKLRLIQMQCDAIRQGMHPLDAAAKMTQMSVSKLKELTDPLTGLREILEDISEDNKI